MTGLKLYAALSRFSWLNYRGKIMMTAFVGIHVPLLALIALFALMAFAFGAISVRLVVLQVSQAKELQDRAFDQRVRTIDLPAQRGSRCWRANCATRVL